MTNRRTHLRPISTFDPDVAEVLALADTTPDIDPETASVIAAATRRHFRTTVEDIDAWGWAA